ncbi:DUF6086 family protein [Streptomyces cyanogenus]|uniref:Uncharacterized protein n=1 Tax=Streptomyces cyanogenus TaxID=80860 RepID=A0ABX7TYU3_STRCY|nr:DUF6086 family protein [Streptomyces cyanogenus]QTE01647.1 hypothetical protein S1361_30235 [Streptomyces cyanogenus]
MSQYFDMGDETLWNPSNGASRLFQRQVEVFEAELELPSGIGPMRNDECQIDPAVFGAFVHALLARHRRTGHTVVLALSEGFVGTVVALAERAGIDIDWGRLEAFPDGPLSDVQVSATGVSAPPEDGGPWAAAVRARAAELGRGMAR